MQNEFQNINEATLWDNLKRRANISLRKLEGIENKQSLLNEFEPEFHPKIIQNLLEGIGKDFFKIFLYEALKNEFENNQINIQKDEFEKLIKSFKFYFWPGFTTLNGKRIHIRGCKRNEDSDHRYFTGIGNVPFEIRNVTNLKRFLESNTNDNPDMTFKYFGKFWIKNIPSVVAFDSVLNQYFMDIEYGENKFMVPSTHFWKSSQIKINAKERDEKFIPMALKSDNSEFRILEISIGENEHLAINNKISISIPSDFLTESGNQIYKRLQRNAVKIDWNTPEDKGNYNEWPFTNKNPKFSKSQLAAYSYWISETLDNKKYCVLDYNTIRNSFKEDGISKFGKKILPFNKFLESYFDRSNFTEVYYNYWTTLFLESYSPKADLGTSMFLTSHQYSPSFLMKCSNWLRWIYNELRLIESLARKQIETQREDKRKLSHTLTGALGAFKHFTDSRIAKKNISKSKKKTFESLFKRINSLLIADSFERSIPQKIYLYNEITDFIRIYKLVSEDKSLFNALFNGIAQKDEIYQNFQNIPFIKVQKSEIVLNNDEHLIGLLIKDQVENLIKHSNKKEPKCSINIFESTNNILIEFCNSYVPSKLVIKSMRENDFPESFQGWRRTIRILKLIDGSFDIFEKENKFIIQISIKK